MATLCIRVVGPSIFLTSMTAEAARVDSCHTGAIVMVGLDFESGAPERGFGTPRATFGWSQLRRKFGQSRGGDTNFGSPRGVPSVRCRTDGCRKRGTNGQQNQ
jgi:hypothetical protein